MSDMNVDRRALLGGLTFLSACATDARAADEASSALLAFLHAFENCDLSAMEAAFAPDATFFDRVAPDATEELAHYRRGQGMPPGMRALAESLPRTSPGPPYHHVTPVDLLIQGSADVAVCSFHLEGGDTLGRRTVVLVRREGGWRILHIHASNVAAAHA